MAAIESVPYKVSLRWLFYRLIEQGIFSAKSDYTNFKTLLGRYRKNRARGWQPDSIVDDTRQPYYRGGGEPTAQEAIESLIDGLSVPLSHFGRQERYVELWYESEAMSRQFQYYTAGLTLRAFKGDISIEPKWRAAKELEHAGMYYGLPVTVLYFGDLDAKGEQIPQSAIRDIRKWCSLDIEFIVCGLNREQVKRYNLIPNPDRAGYQWEALGDAQAAEVITGSVEQYLDVDIVEGVAVEAARLAIQAGEILRAEMA
jgi:hypothetical protein